MANERSIGTFKKALDKLGNFRTKMQDEIIDDVRQKKAEDWMEDKARRKKEADKNYAWQEAMRKGRGMEVPEPYVEETPDVPEIDTKVVDLPKEDENEKELIVEHNDEEEPTDDSTIVEPTPQETNEELENFDESEVVEPPTEENQKTLRMKKRWQKHRLWLKTIWKDTEFRKIGKIGLQNRKQTVLKPSWIIVKEQKMKSLKNRKST